MPVPRGVRPGERTLVIEGNGVAADEEGLIDLVDELFFEDASGSDRREPRNPRQLARSIATLRRPLGMGTLAVTLGAIDPRPSDR